MAEAISLIRSFPGEVLVTAKMRIKAKIKPTTAQVIETAIPELRSDRARGVIR
jgi:hypothetical protein